MTKQNLILIAACFTVGLLLGGEVKAEPTKDVNVVNEPNVNVLNNVDVNVTNDTINPVPVVVQNGTTSAPTKELVEITLDGPSTPTVVYTVPTGQRLIITDVTITLNNSPSSSDFLIQRNNVTISRPTIKNNAVVTDGSVYQRSYLSGIQFNEGDSEYVM